MKFNRKDPPVDSKEIYQYLISKGLSHEHAVGMLTNIKAESGFNPAADQAGDGSQGIGLFQYTQKDRKDAFLKTVPDYKTNWKAQIDFALTENISKKYTSQKFATSAEASDWFTRQWERPKNADSDALKRAGWVNLYESYKTTDTSTTPTLNVDEQVMPNEGLIEKGNIDLSKQPSVKNKETGGNSTVWSMSVGFDGQEVLLTRVSEDGKIMSEKEAIEYYKKTGKHLGKFSSVESANKYAEQLHKDYENGKYNVPEGLKNKLLNNLGTQDNVKIKTLDLPNPYGVSRPKDDMNKIPNPDGVQRPEKKSAGGVIKNLMPTFLSTAASFIPGVGPIIAPFIGAALQNNQKVPEVAVEEERQMMNPQGLKFGGTAPKNLRALNGGRLSKLTSDIYLAKGKPHSKGGIKGDTNMDGKAEIEFEGGELFLDKDGYMVSKPVAKKYMGRIKTLSKSSDSSSKNTLNYLKQSMIAENEQYRMSNDPSMKMKKGGKLPKMQLGNYIANTLSPYNTLSPFSQAAANFSLPFASKNSSPFLVPNSYMSGAAYESAPSSYSAYNTYSKGVGASGMARPINTSKTVNGQGAAKVGLPDWGMTKGDKWSIAAQGVAPLYNLAMGLTQPAETVKPSYNPYNNVVLNNISKMKVNMKPIENQYTRSFNTGMRNLNSLGSTGARFTNANALNSELANQKSLSILQGQQANNELTQYKNNALLSIGADKVNAKERARLETNANKATKQQFIQTGVSKLGQLGQQIGLNSNQVLTNKVLFNTLQNSFNYKFNEEEFANMVNGVKPVGMNEREWILFRNMMDQNSK